MGRFKGMGTVEYISRRPPDTAEEWFARLHSPECLEADRRAFTRWKAACAEHAVAYGEVERLFGDAGSLRDDPLIVAATRKALHLRERSSRLRWLFPATALTCLIGAIGLLRYYPKAPLAPLNATAPVAREIPYSTPVGERLAVTLADGSVVLLDTESSLVVRTSSRERSVRLLSGKARFEVVHDVNRPFTVDVGIGTIRDVGTVFTASKQTGRVAVTVEAGAVVVENGTGSPNIRSARLVPGDQLEFDAAGSIWTTRQVDVRAVNGWTKGDLDFDDQPLEVIVAEMNRYTHSQLRIDDSSLRALLISGVFHAGDQASLISALKGGWGIRARKEASGDVTLYRK